MLIRIMPVRSCLALAAALVVLTTHADAAPTAAAKCAASKIKSSAKTVQSRTGCESKGLSKGEATDAACVNGADAKLAEAFSSAEAKGGCELSTGQADDAQAAVDACIDSFVAAIAGDGSCAGAKMKAVGKSAASRLKCWQKGYLSGTDADDDCLSKAALKLGAAIEKADARGICGDTAAAMATLVDGCVESLLAPGTTTTTLPEATTTTLPEATTTTLPEPTTTTLPETTTTTLPDTTTTTLAEVTTTSTTITTTTTDTTTTTLIDIGPVGWTFCAHAGETCTLPRHDLPISLGGIPPASAYVTAIDGLSIECSGEAMFPGVDPIVIPSGDCYYLNAGCDYEMEPFGVAVWTDEYHDFSSIVNLNAEPPACDPDCKWPPFFNAGSAEVKQSLKVFVVDPRVCDSDDRARLSYHWEIRYPPTAPVSSARIAPQGISGWFENSLTFVEQTLPSLESYGGYREWFTKVEITQEPHADFPLTPAPPRYVNRGMRFRYVAAALSPADAFTCQMQTTPGLPCQWDPLLRWPEGMY